MKLNWYSPVWGHHNGYGNSAEQMVRALERRGDAVGILNQRDITYSGPCDRAWIASHKPQKTDIGIYFTLPTTWAAEYPRSIGFSMYESSTLPDEWIPCLDRVSEIWVPSTFSAEVFGRSTRRSVHVIPLGVNPSIFRFCRQQRSGPLRFLHIAANHGTTNKGSELAIAAFQRAFPTGDGVTLTIQASVGSPPVTGDSRVVATRQAVSQDRFAEYFSGFDALLYTSRGEGFGLLPLEAAATGLPVFHSGKTGMKDYADVGTLIPSREVPAKGQPGTWFEIDVDALAALLREFAESPASFNEKAIRQADQVRNRWSWDRTAERIEERLTLFGA